MADCLRHHTCTLYSTVRGRLRGVVALQCSVSLATRICARYGLPLGDRKEGLQIIQCAYRPIFHSSESNKCSSPLPTKI